MQSRNLLIILGVLLAIGLLGFAVVFFSGYTRQTAETGGVTPSPTTVVSQEEADGEEATEIAVEGSDFKFSPKTISVREGEKVRLTFKNTGENRHNLTVEGLDIATKTVDPGEEDTVVFTATKSGSYKTFCSVGNHRVLGMEGELGVSGE